MFTNTVQRRLQERNKVQDKCTRVFELPFKRKGFCISSPISHYGRPLVPIQITPSVIRVLASHDFQCSDVSHGQQPRNTQCEKTPSALSQIITHEHLQTHNYYLVHFILIAFKTSMIEINRESKLSTSNRENRESRLLNGLSAEQ